MDESRQRFVQAGVRRGDFKEEFKARNDGREDLRLPVATRRDLEGKDFTAGRRSVCFIREIRVIRGQKTYQIVDGQVTAIPKVASAFTDTHVAQMLGYLNITDLEVALLLNFKDPKLDWKRVVRGKPR